MTKKKVAKKVVKEQSAVTVAEYAFKQGKWEASNPNTDLFAAAYGKRLDWLIRPVTLPLIDLDGFKNENNRIYVVVGRVSNGKVAMTCGRAAAQAAHAVSALKLAHLNKLCAGDKSKTVAITAMAEKMHHTSITTIVLQARDEKELKHILQLAQMKGVPSKPFYDTNSVLYKDNKDCSFLTAVAVGPVNIYDSTDVVGYLPLWKCDCD